MRGAKVGQKSSKSQAIVTQRGAVGSRTVKIGKGISDGKEKITGKNQEKVIASESKQYWNLQTCVN